MRNIIYIVFIIGVILSYITPTNLFSQELGSWIQTTPLPSPRSDCAAVAINTTIYVLGGYAYSTIPYPVLRAL